MRARLFPVVALIGLSFFGVCWGTVSAAAVPTDDPTPLATGSSQIGFTVVDTAAPTPPPGGGSGGGSGGSGGTGGGTTPPVCVPSTKMPSLTATPVGTQSTLRVTPSTVSQGQDILLRGSGFQAGEKVVIALYSSPVKLGVFTVRTNGQVYAQVTIPTRTQLGTHTIRAIGFLDCHGAVSTVYVVSPHGSGISVFPWIVWILAGSALCIAGVGILIAFLLGWLPFGTATAATTAAASGIATRVLP